MDSPRVQMPAQAPASALDIAPALALVRAPAQASAPASTAVTAPPSVLALTLRGGHPFPGGLSIQRRHYMLISR